MLILKNRRQVISKLSDTRATCHQWISKLVHTHTHTHTHTHIYIYIYSNKVLILFLNTANALHFVDKI